MIAGIETQSLLIGAGSMFFLIAIIYVITKLLHRKKHINLPDLIVKLEETSQYLHQAHKNMDEMYGIFNEVAR